MKVHSMWQQKIVCEYADLKKKISTDLWEIRGTMDELRAPRGAVRILPLTRRCFALASAIELPTLASGRIAFLLHRTVRLELTVLSSVGGAA